MKQKSDKKRPLSKVLLGILAVFFLYVFYCSGTVSQLDRLKEQEVTDIISVLQKEDQGLDMDMEELNAQWDELYKTMGEKDEVIAQLDDYALRKNEYSGQISELENELESMDYEIQLKQGEIETKKEEARKEEERRIAEEKEKRRIAAEQEAQRKAAQNQTTVWIGDTGTKYHRYNCRTLRGNKYGISLSKALAQGRQACKVCY